MSSNKTFSSSHAGSSLVIGIDPGSRCTGYGVIKLDERGFEPIDFGTVRPPPSKSYPDRCRIIFEGIGALLDRYQPIAFAIETQYMDKNVESAIKLGMARGVAVLAASLREIPVFEYAPARAKRAVVGRGRASKIQVQKMVQHLLGLRTIPEPDDAADALALAICHAHQRRNDVRIYTR